MYDTKFESPIATTPRYYKPTQDIANEELDRYEDTQEYAFVPEQVLITVLQRKADPKDKNRLKWADAKRMALEAAECSDTASVRKWLNLLGVGNLLNLRMTSAWVAVRVDLAHVIKAQKAKSCICVKNGAGFLRSLVIHTDQSTGLEACPIFLGSPSPEENNMGKVVKISDYRKPEPRTDVEILYQAMLDTIASNDWEYLRTCLVNGQEHKLAAWKMLSPHEQQQLKILIPESIRLLKEAVKRGVIASFREDDEGDIFWVWKTSDSEPELVTGTAIAQKLFDYKA